MSRRSSVHEAFLQNIPLAVIVHNDKKMKSVDIHSNVQETLISLCNEDCHVLPVFNKDTNKYEYVISRLDIISMIAWTNDETWKQSPLTDILETEQHIIDPRIFEFTMNDSVIACLEPFSKGVHHVLVRNEEFEETKTENDNSDPEFEQDSDDFVSEQKYYFVSQFQIVQFLYQNIQRMSAIVEAPINAIGLVKERTFEKVFTVNQKMLAKDAFKQFFVHRCDVIAIVNDEKEIISQVSESDIIGVGPEAIDFMLNDEYLSIYDFMSAVNKENQRKNEAIVCKKNAILKELMKLIIERKSNHVFVVDDSNKPMKVITLNDIICKFSPYDYKSNKASKRLSMVAVENKNQVRISLSTLTEEDNDSDTYDYE